MRSIARGNRPTGDVWAARMLALLVAVVVCLPTLGRGSTLVYDMVFVPHPALTSRSWGGDGSLPRAVPMDAVLALLGGLLPMTLVQQAALLAAVGLSVLGAWRVSPSGTAPGRAAAGLVYGWNPYVAERLAQGHWSLLLGYALLPWVLLAGVRLATGEGRVSSLLVLTLIGAVASPTAGVLTGLLAAGLALHRGVRRRDRALVLGAVVLGNATWALPGVLATAAVTAGSRAGAEAFAATSDTPLGPVVSVLTGGGIWNTLVHPASRATAASAAAALVLLVLAVLGWVVLLRAGRRRARRDGRRDGADPVLGAAVLLTLAAAGLLVALGSLTVPGRDALAWVGTALPGGGLLRDAQKWSAWYLLAVAVGVGPGAEWATSRFARGPAAGLVLAAAITPVLALPDLGYGVAGRLEAVTWPAEYSSVARLLDAQPDPGAVLALPWHAFRAWPWNDDRTVLDPWPRLVDRPVVVRDDLELSTGVVPGEDPMARQVGDLVRQDQLDAAHLRALGIRYVVLDDATAGGPPPSVDGQVLHEGPLLRVVDLGPATPASSRPKGVAAVVAVDLGAALALVGALAAELRAGTSGLVLLRRRIRGRGDPER